MDEAKPHMNQDFPVTLYSTTSCGYCRAAASLLAKRGIPYQEIDLTDNAELRMALSQENNGYRTVPMIYIRGTFIGGYTELRKLEKKGELEGLEESPEA